MPCGSCGASKGKPQASPKTMTNRSYTPTRSGVSRPTTQSTSFGKPKVKVSFGQRRG